MKLTPPLIPNCRPGPPTRRPLSIPLFLFLALFSFPLVAANITNSLLNPFFGGTNCPVNFHLIQAYSPGSSIYFTEDHTYHTDATGFLNIQNIGPGNYTVLIGPEKNRFVISVPNDQNTYDLETLISFGLQTNLFFPLRINLGYLAAGGATNGQYLVFTNGFWQPGNAPAGGSTPTLFFSADRTINGFTADSTHVPTADSTQSHN